MSLPVAVISDRAKKRLKSKHPWIFSNEIERKPEAGSGDSVDVQDKNGNYVATGYYNPRTLIAIRILSYHHTFPLADRIRKAVKTRNHDFSAPVYRAIYGESDGLPGLIADRYGDTLVLQLLTAGIEKLRAEILTTLIDALKPLRILLRNDSSYRQLEGLPEEVIWAHGDALERDVVEMDGLKFEVNFVGGQKTGFFLDQRANRHMLLEMARGESMLDAFCYTGAWSVYGAKAGLTRITAVDSSEEALQAAQQNAERNGFHITTINEDVMQFLRAAYSKPERYDVIVLDPPAFCKSRKNLAQAVRGYREINLRAMKLLNRDGLLFTCSCSQPVTPEIFEDILRQAAADSGRAFVLRKMLFQPPDHPVLLHFPESHYLKCAVLQLAER